jgi:hypothetical protein
MNSRLRWMPEAVRSSGSLVCWRALACGLITAFAIQLAFLLAFSLGASGFVVSANRTAAMICACVASLAGAAICGLLTSRSNSRYVATNAYPTWLAANVVLMANVGLATDPTG